MTNNHNSTAPDTRTLSIEVHGTVYAVDIDQPMTTKELSFFLGRNRSYISAMKKAGFAMRRDHIQRQAVASISQAHKWLEENPAFSFNRTYRPKL